jgi:hypothetical protein
MSKEIILISAIWYKDLENEIKQSLPINCDSGVVILGHRHGQCIYTLLSLKGLRTVTHAPDGAGRHVQGFLTSKNRFVDRKEAAQIAFDMAQTKDHKKILFSEDLY